MRYLPIPIPPRLHSSFLASPEWGTVHKVLPAHVRRECLKDHAPVDLRVAVLADLAVDLAGLTASKRCC